MRPMIVVCMLALVTAGVCLVPAASASTCTVTPLAGGFKLVTCDTDGDGNPNTFCVTGPRLGPCYAP